MAENRNSRSRSWRALTGYCGHIEDPFNKPHLRNTDKAIMETSESIGKIFVQSGGVRACCTPMHGIYGHGAAWARKKGSLRRSPNTTGYSFKPNTALSPEWLLWLQLASGSLLLRFWYVCKILRISSRPMANTLFSQGRAGLVAMRRYRGTAGALGRVFYKGGFEPRMNRREAALILQLKCVEIEDVVCSHITNQ
jgi:hypothetical protein